MESKDRPRRGPSSLLASMDGYSWFYSSLEYGEVRGSDRMQLSVW